MRNKQIGNAHFLLDMLQQIDNLCLYGNIQCTDGLITDDELRIQGKCSGNSNTLTLSAGKFMRVTADVIRLQPDDIQQLTNPLLPFFLRVENMMNIHWLTDNFSYRHTGIQTCIGILKNHLYIPAEFRKMAAFDFRNILSMVIHRSACGLIKLDDCTTGGTFSTAAFSNKSKGFSRIDFKADTVHGLYHLLFCEQTALDREMHLQVFHLQYCITHWTSPPLHALGCCSQQEQRCVADICVS